MINWIRKFFLKKAVNKKKISDIEQALDESIKQAIQDSNTTARIADKALKQKILQQQTDRTIRKLQELDEDYDEEEEEEEQEETFEDKIKNQFMEKIFGNIGVPKNPQAAKAQEVLKNPENLKDLISTITPEQMKLLKEKGFM